MYSRHVIGSTYQLVSMVRGPCFSISTGFLHQTLETAAGPCEPSRHIIHQRGRTRRDLDERLDRGFRFQQGPRPFETHRDDGHHWHPLAQTAAISHCSNDNVTKEKKRNSFVRINPSPLLLAALYHHGRLVIEIRPELHYALVELGEGEQAVAVVIETIP
jgi:hypothetical protein